MKKRNFLLVLTLTLSIVLALFSWSAMAVNPVPGDCSKTTVSAAQCDSCVSSAFYQNLASGNQIITGMFTAINNVLGNVENNFYNGIVGNNGFQAAITTAIVLYVAIYGMMITFNLGSYKIAEVVNRLMKVGVVYLMTSPASWAAFTNWVNTPLVNGMNQVIRLFTVTVEQGPGQASFDFNSATGGMDANGFADMFGSSMTSVFSMQLFVAIMSMLTVFPYGWAISLFILWALIEFFLMMIGALITYAKAIIGLAFLFGIAPIFFILLLFERSRPMFYTWISQVLVFILQPILLFGFLSFYVALITQAVPLMLQDKNGTVADFCWLKWLSIPGTMWELYANRPSQYGQPIPALVTTTSGDVVSEAVNVHMVLYFLILCYLGKTFCNYLEDLAQDLVGGVSPGIVRGGDVAGFARSTIGGTIKTFKGKTSR